MKIQSFKDLMVWQKSRELTLEIYKITTLLPEDEKFGLISQILKYITSNNKIDSLIYEISKMLSSLISVIKS